MSFEDIRRKRFDKYFF